MSQSAIYQGQVYHCRHVPKKHQFDYSIFLFWLDLQQQEEANTPDVLPTKVMSAVRFRRQDYLNQPERPLYQVALDRMSELAGTPLQGKVFLLGQVRMFGLYFSPANFYYLQQADGSYSHVLVEVSNTPWNQRHCYLVDLNNQQDTPKAFHVSPFNPMDMSYRWSISQPGEQLHLHIDCVREQSEFVAGLTLKKITLNPSALFNVMIRIPCMGLKTVWGIYWQALKLALKRVPFYSYPKQQPQDSHK